MRSLLLSEPAQAKGEDASVADVVTWFGAMQAQDYASGLWSLGARLPSATRADIEAALESREALRTWPMRGTIHLVPSRDASWMVRILGERALAGAEKRREYLGLDDATADRAVAILAEVLAGGARLTRAQCVAALEAHGIPGAGQLGYHLLWYASQRGVTCIGPQRNGEQTFVLLDEWVPDPILPDREEALAIIATRYVRSHGPTTRRDFIGWTGLTAADADAALAAAGAGVTTVDVEGQEMLVAPGALEHVSVDRAGAAEHDPAADHVCALPGFDEYLLGFKDRSLMLDPEHAQAIIPGGNGVFQPTIAKDGRVIATWKRKTLTKRTKITIHPLVRLRAADRLAAVRAFGPYERFLATPVTVDWA